MTMPNTPTYMKQWRKYRGLTQQQVADALDTSKGYVSDLERGERRYNQDVLEALARLFRCQPGDILSINPEAPIESVDGFEYLRKVLGMDGFREVQEFVQFKISQHKD